MSRPVLSQEHLLLFKVGMEVLIYRRVHEVAAGVRAVHVSSGGGIWHAYISIEKLKEGEGTSAALAALTANNHVKLAVVVDHDVDVFNPAQVEWAMATRVQAGRDVTIVRDARGTHLEPSSRDGVSDKMAVDATVPLGQLTEEFRQTVIPGEQTLDLTDYLTVQQLRRVQEQRVAELSIV